MNQTMKYRGHEREHPPGRIGNPVMLTAHPKFRGRSEPVEEPVLEIQPVKAGTPPAGLVDQLVNEKEWGVPTEVVDAILADQEREADLVEAIIAEQEGRRPVGRLELLR